MATDGFILEHGRIRQEIAIIALLLSKLIACCQQQRFTDLNIMLPFNPITDCFNLRPERKPYQSRGPSHKITFNCTAVTPQIFSRP